MLASWKKSYDKPRQHVKKQSHLFTSRSLYSQSYGFSSSLIQMWELDHKEGLVPKNWSFLTMLLEKTLGSPLDSKEIKPINPKGNPPWIFIGRMDTEDPILYWPPDMKSQLTEKDSDARKDWGQEKKRATNVWVAQSTQWTWVWSSSGRQWRSWKPGALQSMGLERQTQLGDWTTSSHNHRAKSSFRGIAAFTIMIMKPLADSRSSCYRHRVHKRAWISLCDSVSANTVFLCAFISKLNSIFRTRAARKYRKFTFMFFQIFFFTVKEYIMTNN